VDNEDAKLWREVTKDVIPINKPATENPEPVKPIEVRSPLEIMDEQLDFNIQSHNHENPNRLDLHGHTLDRAYEITQSFIARCHHRGVKFATVITGQGTGNSSITREFTEWVLAGPCRSMVIEVYPERPETVPGAYTIQIKSNLRCQSI